MGTSLKTAQSFTAYLAPGVSSGVGGSQTPWLSNIDGGNYNLSNVNGVDAQYVTAGAAFQANDVASGNSFITFQHAGSARWILGKNSTAEGAGNTGSDYMVHRYDNSGTYLGNPVTIQRSNGFVGLNGQSSPTYPLDVAGDVNVSGHYYRAGIPIAIATQAVVTGSRAAGVVYQNTTSKTLFVVATWNLAGTNSTIDFVCDASNPPTTLISQISYAQPQVVISQLFCMVLPNYYYECQVSGGTPTLVAWVEYS
jgi:hypothetical protein